MKFRELSHYQHKNKNGQLKSCPFLFPMLFSLHKREADNMGI